MRISDWSSDVCSSDLRGVGPRVQRIPYTTDADGNQTLVTDKDRIYDDALGGKAYYLGPAELEIPLGPGAQELGLRPSIFMDFGALIDGKKPLPTAVDGKSAGEGKSVSGRVAPGGRRHITKKTKHIENVVGGN